MYAKPVVSMYNAAKKKGVEKKNQSNQFPFAALFFDEDTRHDTIQKIIFRDHCAPYLHMIEAAGVDYEIIDFNHLGNYIPIAARTNITSCDNSSLDDFIENDIFTKDDMKNEFELYEHIKATKREISVQDWKNLTILH